MRVLWVCNIMLPVIAAHLGREASNKEGWLSGLADVILGRQQENRIELGVAFPVEKEADGLREILRVRARETRRAVPDGLQTAGEEREEREESTASLICYGFYEDIANAERYDAEIETRLKAILEDFRPDVIHCFGTEYSHTLAVLRVCPHPEKVLVGIQGLCAVYAHAYMASLPEKVRNRVTLRDWLRQDSIRQQQEKFVLRGKAEREAIALTGNVTGRTAWDRFYTEKWNPRARYFEMNETLRPLFYQAQWSPERCKPYSVFLSQGDYPIKGLHYMLLALPEIRKRYPNVEVAVAGNSVVGHGTLKEKLKLSAYGKYLLRLIREEGLEDCLEFLGKLDEEQMRDCYLRSNVFVCCSSIENSPNSLGEAMLLGMPCVSADVGGIPSLFEDGKDGILYSGYRTADGGFDQGKKAGEDTGLEGIVANLSAAVIRIFEQPQRAAQYGRNARLHASRTHDREKNYATLMRIYEDIAL